MSNLFYKIYSADLLFLFRRAACNSCRKTLTTSITRYIIPDMFDTVLFDLDGTVSDPYEGITKAIAYALERFGISVTDRRTLVDFIGPPLYDSFTARYGFTFEQAEQAVDYYREYYADKGVYENVVYPGIAELIKELKRRGKCVALATSKPEKFARQIIDRYELTEYFDYIAGATLDTTRIKKADVIAYALENLGSPDTSRAIMVGDRKHDIIGGKAVGIKTLGVLYGFGSREELTEAKADYIVATPAEILDIV